VNGAVTIDGIEEETMLTLLLTGCGRTVVPMVSSLPVRTLQVATPTPYVGRVRVISAHERDLLAVTPVTGAWRPRMTWA
jgi:hypothetical protein